MLPLSGGADSSATAAIVGSMCQLVTTAVAEGNKVVEADARRLELLINNVMHTAEIETDRNAVVPASCI